MKKRKFEFNLSFQQGYGVYKLSHATASHSSPPLENPAYHNLFSCDLSNSRLDALQSGGVVPNLGPDFDLSTTCPEDSSSHAELLLEAVAGGGEALADCPPSLPHESSGGDGEFHCVPPLPTYPDHNLTDTSSVFEGSERRLSHEECRKIELTDWEWCRSKSERTPRQVHHFAVVVSSDASVIGPNATVLRHYFRPKVVTQLLNLHSTYVDALKRLALREISESGL